MSVADERRNNFWHSHTSSDTVVVFVHGIFSDSRTCWSHKDRAGRHVFWPDLIAGDTRLADPARGDGPAGPQPSIFLAGYHTALDAGDFPIAQCAREVIDALKRPEINGTPAVLQTDRIIFICHSTGGIVVRYMLERYRELFTDKAVGLALIASPSLGSGWANLASLAAKYYDQRLGLQLRWDNSELEDLHGRFRDLVAQKTALMPGLFGMEAAEHTMVFRDRIPRWIRWALPLSLKVVSSLSAGQYFGSLRILANTNHFTTVKPSSVRHPAHEFIIDFAAAFRATSQQLRASRVVQAVEPPVLPSAVVTLANEAAVHDTPWPIAPRQELSTFAFLSEAGFDSDSDVTVVSYIAVEDHNDLSGRVDAEIVEMLQDPYFRALPAVVAALRSKRVDYQAADVAVRTRVTELLGSLIFEAYVCFSRQDKTPKDLLYDRLILDLLFQRLRAGGNDPVTLTVGPSSKSRNVLLASTVDATVARIKRTDRREVVVQLRIGQATEPGCIVAEYVSQIVLQRLRFPQTLEARAFERIHPTKLRLIQDFDRGEFFSRKRRFAG